MSVDSRLVEGNPLDTYNNDKFSTDGKGMQGGSGYLE